MAGNLSPGRHHQGHHGHRRDSGGGGFFKNFFGRRDKHHDQPLQHQYPGDAGGFQAPPPNTSPGSKLKALLSFAPHHAGARTAVPMPGRANVDDMQVKELQHRVQLLTAQTEGYEKMKMQLQAEQRAAQEWKEKWNYQNFKLNVMVDMLVLRVLELEQPSATPAR